VIYIANISLLFITSNLIDIKSHRRKPKEIDKAGGHHSKGFRHAVAVDTTMAICEKEDKLHSNSQMRFCVGWLPLSFVVHNLEVIIY
jgi:hypothetical protein